ncbi:glycosyl hydrolase family 88, putative [Metarhizium acridum CQMa 102]|uniref:Glycosyl hydrolase family 88, putative n=1 Tax=Metarhizium acridum (strain CQMa 102) TaxID=655827 RepID=E9E980_METAQ|nr:glycosyl hydrolase family 88, putative [Metarhizium acridum CQMa 102]EFY87584.1 glycosyl hydrolase family 88, putative [Metarhizium acridum CQMa 102]
MHLCLMAARSTHMTYLEHNGQQLWDDTLMMTVLPLAKIGLVFDRPHYVAGAKGQFPLHIQYLFDAKTGLFSHGWTLHDDRHHFAGARWARGNRGLTIEIPEFIELLDLDRSNVSEEDGSYGESSATAGLAFGLLKGQRKRYIQGEYQYVALKAVRGVLENISPDGRLQNTSFGTGMGSDLEFYKEIPITPMLYGQAMAILALVELLNIFI